MSTLSEKSFCTSEDKDAQERSSETRMNVKEEAQDERRNFLYDLPKKIYPMDFRTWPFLSLLKPEFTARICMVMVYGKWVLIVTKDKNVYILNRNKDDHSNIGDTNIGLHPKKMQVLCGKNIKTFACNSYFVLALTEEGEVYSWGFNKEDKSNNGSHIPVIASTPTRVISLSEKCIVDIACGSRHSLALTSDGKVYSWRENYGHVGDESTGIFDDNLSWKMKPEFEGMKIVSIACGSMFNMVITDEGKLYGWGDNESGQIAVDPTPHFAVSDIPQFGPVMGLFNYDQSERKHHMCFRKITVKDGKTIVKVTCGFEHTLALTDEGKLYAWGKNDKGQMGVNDELKSFAPIMVNLPEKVIDIAAYGNLSTAIDSNEIVYVWGDCFGQNITTPIPTGFCKMYDALAHSKSYYIMQKPLTVTITKNYVEELLNILKSLEAAFDDLLTSDFTVQVEGKFIHVHRAILNIRCQHFRNKFQHGYIENENENLPPPSIYIDKFSYIVYKAFLKYLYTGIVDLPSDKILELMKLADEYCETNLKKECGRIIEQEITASNVAFFYNEAIECNAKEFEEFCFQFALCHMKDVVLSEKYIKLDANIKNNFIHRAAEENAFRT